MASFDAATKDRGHPKAASTLAVLLVPNLSRLGHSLSLTDATSEGPTPVPTHSKTLLSRYHYDPLDRLFECTLPGQENARRFYQKDHLATEINGTVKRTIMQYEDQLLAQQQRQSESVETSLLATDKQRSVLKVLGASTSRPITHTPYGHRPLASGLFSLLGFNGERSDPVTGHYLLGNGYRAFNPVLMRFNSPDSWSPFWKGGLNAYAYCEGDPVNYSDPTGHAGGWGLLAKNLTTAIKRTKVESQFSSLPVSRRRSVTYLPRQEQALDASVPKKASFIGYHGSTKENAASLIAGIDAKHMDSAGGLSSGKGFYVAPTKQTAIDFSEVAASYTANGTPQIFAVHVKNFTSMRPGHHYRFRTMGEGGLTHRNLNEMEIIMSEISYKSISIRMLEKQRKPILPRASEAPF